jgi:isochorismate synthase EntC
LEAAALLHPTPAVGGVPPARAAAVIRESEPFDRGWYAGPIGWMDDTGNGEFFVALRSALVEGDHAHVYAGCGLVAGSEAAAEWNESRLKMGAVLCAL